MKKVVAFRAVVVGFLVLAPALLRAQESGDCLACHADKTLETKRGGQRVSLFVDEGKFSASVHGPLSCVGCHTDLVGAEFPHGVPVKKVDCGSCHDDVRKLAQGDLHGRAVAKGDPLAPRCRDCHGEHDILPVKDRASSVAAPRIPFVCGKCHREGAPVARQREIHQTNILENYTESIHGEGLLKKGLIVTATCASCHSAHQILPHTDPRSSIARRNIATTCTRCHAQIEAVHRKVIRGELWEKEQNVLPACVDCHQPHTVRKVFYDQGMADRDCLSCHENPGLKAAKDGRPLFVDAGELSGSRHAKTSCSQCHSGVNPSSRRPCETLAAKVDCSVCHAQAVEQYQLSIHGQLFAKNDSNAPTCRECHGTHGVLGRTNPVSRTFPTNVPDLCARCHREGERAAVRYMGTEHDIINRYTESIHGKGLLKSGLVVTAMCTDCHTAHGERQKTDPESTVNQKNIPKTCGRCHHGIEEMFVQSIHSPTIAHTDEKLPVCSDCHTAHSIRRTDLDGFKLEIMNQCGKCHGEIAKTYFDTYHGKVSRLGYTKTAKCYDCHGAHDILPVSDPRSHLSRGNVVGTCQKCHPGATRRFAGYLTHATHHDPKKYPWLFWTFWGMTTLLVGTFIVGGLHTLLWIPRAVQWRREIRRSHSASAAPPAETAARGLEMPGAAPAPHVAVPRATQAPLPELKGREYQRFTRLERLLHLFMIVSFIALALTGMTLKFSYTPWAATLSRLLGGFETAGYIHRMGAVVMIGIFTVHLVDLVRRRKRDYGSWRALLFGPNAMLPTKKDLEDFTGSMRWFLGLGPRPRYGRWTYWEKFDYLAVFWGIAVIGSTGLLLWFSEFLTRFLPGSLLNVATIIHSDEALLATGFIFTVHFFNTHLRPEKFPMDIVIFTGRMPVEEFARDKPAEYEDLVRSGRLEDYLVEAYPPIVIRTIRAFAWTALSIGFGIVVWIIYAMLFAYR